jgi:DNA-binding CsgD family transcriptional regulator
MVPLAPSERDGRHSTLGRRDASMEAVHPFVSQSLARLVAATRQVATFRPGIRLRIGVPLAMVSAALLLADVARPVFPAGGVFLLLLVPVLGSAVALGSMAGVVALTSGAFGAVLMVVLRDHPWMAGPADALRVVPYLFLGGFIVVVASVLRSAVTHQPGGDRRTLTPFRLIEPLTAREEEVLALAASGLATDEIARRLFLSRNTVKTHLAHAYGKLGAHNRAEAVAAALHSGTLDGSVVMSRAPEITETVMRPAAARKAGSGVGAP